MFSIDKPTGPHKYKIAISIVAVNRMDHIDWLIIWWMIWTTCHLIRPHVPSFLVWSNSFDLPTYRNEQVVIVTFHLHTLYSFDKFGLISTLIHIPVSTRHHRSCIVQFTMLKEQELVFIWGLYVEANIFKLHIFRCNNNHLFISTRW